MSDPSLQAALECAIARWSVESGQSLCENSDHKGEEPGAPMPSRDKKFPIGPTDV